MDQTLFRRLLGLLLALISLVCSIGFLATSSPSSENRPAYIAWTTVSGAVLYLALMVCFLTWLQLRDKWNGSQEDFDPVYKCDSRSSSEISKGEKAGEDSMSTFYWRDENFRAKAEGTLPLTPETVPRHFSQRDGFRLSSIPEFPPSPTVGPYSPAYSLDLRVPPPRSRSPAYFLDLRVPPPAHIAPATSTRKNSLMDIQIPSPALKFGVNPRDPYGLSVLPKQLSFDRGVAVAYEVSVFQGKAKEVDVKVPKQDDGEDKEVVKEEMRKKVEAMRAALREEAEEDA